MTQEDLGMFLHNLYAKAFAKMSDDPTWGYGFVGNCLPACRTILEDIRRKFPTAHIVIGLAYPAAKAPEDLQAKKDEIKSYLKAVQAGKPDFHAWIALHGSSFFDPVGPTCFSANSRLQSCSYWDANLAKQSGFVHEQVLTAVDEVEAFYERLLNNQQKKN